MSKWQSSWMFLLFHFFCLPFQLDQLLICVYIFICLYTCRPRRSRPPPPGNYRDPYDDDPYYRDPYADHYYRSRYLPPPPPGHPGYARYDPYYDPYDRRPLPLPSRDPYLRDRLTDPYARPHPDYYARRSPPLSGVSTGMRWVSVTGGSVAQWSRPWI